MSEAAAKIMTEIADLRADSLIATDEGTHSHPRDSRVYQRINGTIYYRQAFAGASLGDIDVREMGEVPYKGRLRRLVGLTAEQRRARVATLEAELAKSESAARAARGA